MAHNHTMTPEYDADMEALRSAVEFLRTMNPDSEAAKHICDRVTAIAAAADQASSAIADFREAAQPDRDSGNPTEAELGAWAGGLGRVPLHAGHKVCEELQPGRTAEAAGRQVNAFFDVVAEEDRTAKVLHSLIQAAIREGGAQLPANILSGLHRLIEKITKRSEVPLHTPCDAQIKSPPPYYWPSTYVSSSSSGSASSSTWPPP